MTDAELIDHLAKLAKLAKVEAPGPWAAERYCVLSERELFRPLPILTTHNVDMPLGDYLAALDPDPVTRLLVLARRGLERQCVETGCENIVRPVGTSRYCYDHR